MLNRLILSVKTAALNHKQIRDILIGGEEEHKGQEYPLARVWPAGIDLRSNEPSENIYKIVISVSDRHQDNPTSELECISDCSAIVIDILATLNYIYRSENITWNIQDRIEHFYDASPDKVAGAMVTLSAKVPFNNDFCQVPSRDFDFPSIGLLALSVIDEGYSDSTYTSSNIVNGGIA